MDNSHATQIILLHGLNTNPTEKWYPWLATEMRQRDLQCEIPALSSGDPHLSEWIAEIDKLKPDENTILVGHSRGGVALLRWLEMQPKSRKVKKVILIATNSGSIQKMPFPDESNHAFYTKEGYDFTKIKQHCDDFVVLHSKDDQWVPYEHGQENAKGLNARLVTFERYGHFGKDTKEIPELVYEIEKSRVMKSST